MEPIMYKRILVPVDGSDTSTRGLREALRIAKVAGARLRLINVVDESVVTQPFESYVDTSYLIEALREGGKKALERALSVAGRNDFKAESVLCESLGESVADIILREAKKWKADLIVMGTHGRRGFNRVVLGSDAEAVLRDATVPVLMIRSTEGKKKR
jgi:nucleotide-binding universal stress UspA family protein